MARLRDEFAKVAAAADLREALLKGGGKPLQLTGDAAREVVRRDVEQWSRLVRTLSVKAE
jgi:tripartite-type tricarboxylate transporter receptor subunit TctC